MMSFIKFPEHAINAGLSKPNLIIYLHLLQLHYHHGKGDYKREFYITDRDLADITRCGHHTVTKTKKLLRDLNLIKFRTGPKNTTYYTIIPHII